MLCSYSKLKALQRLCKMRRWHMRALKGAGATMAGGAAGEACKHTQAQVPGVQSPSDRLQQVALH